jgi:hypothetical protein
MPSFDKPILRMARHVADIKRGRESIEEKAEAIGSFVTSFLLETQTVRRSVAKRPARLLSVKSRASVPPPDAPRRAASKEWPAPAKPEPAPAFVEETAESIPLEAAAPPAPLRIIRLTPPIIVKQLATELGLKPQQIIKELMTFNVFANINQTIEPDIASKIAESHGFILEIDSEERISVHREATPPEEVTTTSLEQVIHKLHTDTILFLNTADTLAAALREYDLDWSAAVIMLCKAFEKETNVRLIVPLREKTRGRDLKVDTADKDLGRIARFCSAAGQPPELGTLAYFLNTAIHSKQRRVSSILLQAFYELVSEWPRSRWLIDEFGLEAALKRLTKEFRNPAAHIQKLSENDFRNCRNFMREAPEIVMLKLFLATSR